MSRSHSHGLTTELISNSFKISLSNLDNRLQRKLFRIIIHSYVAGYSLNVSRRINFSSEQQTARSNIPAKVRLNVIYFSTGIGFCFCYVAQEHRRERIRLTFARINIRDRARFSSRSVDPEESTTGTQDEAVVFSDNFMRSKTRALI